VLRSQTIADGLIEQWEHREISLENIAADTSQRFSVLSQTSIQLARTEPAGDTLRHRLVACDKQRIQVVPPRAVWRNGVVAKRAEVYENLELPLNGNSDKGRLVREGHLLRLAISTLGDNATAELVDQEPE